MNSVIQGILVAIVGAYIGAVADRFSYWFHVSRSMIWRKHCPKCFSPEAWMTYLPIFGFVIRRGVCVMCKQQLPIAPFLAELTGALSLGYVWLTVFGSQIPAGIEWLHVLLVILAVGGMIVLAISDLVFDEVPFSAYLVTLGALMLRLFFFSDTQTFVFSIFAAIMGGFFMSLLVIISRWRWVHAHDILFGILIGFIVGWPGFFVTLAFAYIFAVIGGIISWAWGKNLWKGTSSYGLYLFVALAAQGAVQIIAALCIR